MPDWERVVRAKLPALHVRPEREEEIVAELALELEQVYGDTLAGGASETEAAQRAHEPVGGRATRRSLCAARTAQESGLRHDRGIDACLRDRWQHRHLHHCGRG